MPEVIDLGKIGELEYAMIRQGVAGSGNLADRAAGKEEHAKAFAGLARESDFAGCIDGWRIGGKEGASIGRCVTRPNDSCEYAL